MALVLADRVLETTQVTGTGDANLGGAQANYQPFSVIGDGSTTYYTIVDNTNNSWEVGVGTYVLAGNKITRDTVLSSSNGGALVYFASGAKDIFLDLPSEKVLLTAGDVTGPASAINNNFAAFNLTTGKLIKDSGYNASTFATAAQGAKADTAVQPGSLGTAAYLNAGSANGVASLDAGGKVPITQIPASVIGALSYQGTWNALTNVPTLVSSAGTKGFYYVVATAGTTNLNGISDWQIGDWAVFDGSVWEKIDNTDAVNSVNGYTGTVVLTAADVSAIPYTGATGAVDLNAKTLVNVANLGVNTTTVPTIRFRAVGDNNSGSRIAMRGYSSDANSSSIRVSKFRGTSGAPQAPISGDSLGKFELAGYGTTASEAYPQVSLEGVTTEVWGATARGAKAVIKVTPNTTITQVTAVTVDQDSKVTLAGALAVTGTTTLATSLSGLAKLTSGVVSTATSGTDYAPATSGSSILYGNAAGGFSNVTIGSGVAFSGGTLSATGSGGTVTSVTGTAPVVSSGGTTPAISMAAATTSVSGYLTSTDWTTFNNKSNTNGTVTSVAALTIGTTGTDLSSTVATGTTTPVITLQVPTASATNRGALSSTDWTTFNNKGSGTVTSVTGTAPVVSSGGATPAISMPAATTSVSGYLTSTDWTTFNGKYSTGGALGTPSSGTLTNCTGLPVGGISATGTPSSTTYLRGDGTWSTVASVGVTSVTGTAPISVVTTLGVANVSISQSTTSTNGYLSSTDWNTFNGKQPAGTYINSVSGTANQVTASTSTGAVTLSTPSTFIAPGSIAATTTVTGTNIIPSGSTAATNGMFLPTTNAVGFSTASTERMRIDASGNLFVGTTSNPDAGKISIAYTSGVNNGIGMSASATTTQAAIVFRNPNGVVGQISTNGSATTYATSSDYRLKENIAPMTDALEKVAQLKPVTYKWKSDGSDGQGFIAHELQTVVPDCVTGQKDAVETYTDEDGVEQTRPVYQGIDTSFLVGTLTAAIQELKAIIDTQQTRITALNEKVGI